MPMMASTAIERRKTMRGLRKQRQAEAQHAVGAQLQHHARQHHRARGGRFGVRVRQPGMQREERHLDGKGQEERAEQQHFGAHAIGHLHRTRGSGLDLPADRMCRSRL